MRGSVARVVPRLGRWALLVALALTAAVLLPLSASAYLSTGPTGDRGWLWQNPLPQGNDLRASAWASSSTGWTVGVTGTALKTTDGGTTWVAMDPGTTRDLTGVSFTNASTGWIVGLSGTVLHTTDGGTTWASQSVPAQHAGHNLRAVSFFNSSVGAAVGDAGASTSTILYTSDGGATWRSASTTATVGLTSVQMVSATTGWAVGGAGDILKTTDGGATWTMRATPTAAGLSCVSFEPSGTVGYIVGNAVLPSWTIFKTTDGGATWAAVNGLGATGAINLTGVSCLDANNAVTVGTNGQIRHTTDGGVTWSNQSQNNVGANALRAVKMIDANTIKAVGDIGMIFTTADSGNFWTTPMLGVTATHQAVWFVDANDGWTAGSNGTIMRTSDAGRTWTTLASGITVWRAIYFADANNGWVAGDGGAIERTTNGGVTWTPASSGVTVQLNGIWFADATNGYAVGNTGTILKSTDGGATWSAKSSGTANHLNAVWFVDKQSGWAVGAGGAILYTHNNGNSWATQTSGTSQTLLAVRGVDANTVWVAGNGGTMLKTTNGSSWSALSPGAGTNPIRGLTFVNTNTGWYVSNYGLVKKTTDGGSTWVQQNAALPTSTTDAVTGLWGVSFVDANTGFIVGDSGAVRRTLDGGATWTSTQYGTQANIVAATFSDASNGWVSGASGLLMRTTDGGTTWSVQKPGTTSALNALWMSPSLSGWAVGDNGTVRRTLDGGATWTSEASGVTGNFKAVASVDGTHAIVAGSGALKYTSDAGSTWTSGTTIPTQPVTGLSMVSNTEAFATATRLAGNNVIWHTLDGGATWTSQATPANAQLWAITFISPTTGFAVGDNGTILRTTNSGTTWSLMPVSTTSAFYAVSFVDSSHGIVAGNGGIIAVTGDGGSSWVVRSSGTARTLNGIGYQSVSRAFAVGNLGTLLVTGDLTPPTTTMSTTPAAPDGNNGWFRTDPFVGLFPNKTATTYYGWTSSAGPFLVYTGPVPAPQGSPTLFYYSVDTSLNAEAVKSAVLHVDYTSPTVPSGVSSSAIGTSTAGVAWGASTDTPSGLDHYTVSVNGSALTTTTAQSMTLTGLSPSTAYSVTVNAVDVAGNASAQSTPTTFTTSAVDTTPITTLLGVTPALPDGANGWYVTQPHVTMSGIPATASVDLRYSWNSLVGPYSSYAATLSPAQGASTLYFSAHDPLGVRATEATRQASFQVDTAIPGTPVLTASATAYDTVRLAWTPVADTSSTIAYYQLWMDGAYAGNLTGSLYDVAGLAPSSTHSFRLTAVNVAGSFSAFSATQTVTTPPAPRPTPPSVVYAVAPTDGYANVNWSAATSTVGAVSYRIWRSSDGASYSAIATNTGGVLDTTFVDSGLASTKRYWYSITTVDSRGESDPSARDASVWGSIAATTGPPSRPQGLTASPGDNLVDLSWQPSVNSNVVGYYVLRAPVSLAATSTTLTALPTAATFFTDTLASDGETYYYSVRAVDASGTIGSPSLEAESRPQAPFVETLSPHDDGGDSPSACTCHSAHSGADEIRTRFPGANKDTLCQNCHPPVNSYAEFIDPLAKSRHPEGSSVTSDTPYTCTTCHRPVKHSNEDTASLLLVNGSWPCVEVTNTPAGDGFCYSCHGRGSTLPQGDLTGFESSGHANVIAPATGANVKCDTCHEPHASRNEHLNKYSGYMMCMQCHTASTSNPNEPDIWSRLQLNEDANAKHPLLPQDQTNGARMSCQNCHNTHMTTANNPLVDPHNPSPSGTWTTPRSNEKAFCFTCHNGQALPTSAETTPWANAVLASNGATTVTDIKDAYQTNVHGFGQRSDPTTTTAFLRTDMGYTYGTVLECRSCHDPHGTPNNYALQTNVVSANGGKTVTGVMVARVPGGGYDFRFFCSACHLWDSTSHDAMTGADTHVFPTNCMQCHRHVTAGGSYSSNL